MASFVSPGVYIVEKDLSDYPASINPSVVGVVGFSNSGPVNKATLITSQEQLVQTFGNPSEGITGQGLEGSIEMLEATNSLYYVRAVGSDAVDASSTIQLGSCPAFAVASGHFGQSNATSGLYLEVQVNVDGTDIFNTPKTFNIPAGTVTGSTSQNRQAIALKKIIGGGMDGAAVGSFYDTVAGSWVSGTGLDYGYVAAGYAGSDVILTASAWTDTTKTVGQPVLQDINGSGGVNLKHWTWRNKLAASSVSVTGISFNTAGAGGIAYSVQSLYAGAGYNLGTAADGTTSGFSSEVTRTGGDAVNLQINKDGATAESFKISLVASGSFAEDVINTGATDLKSQYIKAYFTASGADASLNALPTFESNLSANGLPNPNILGDDGSNISAVDPKFVKPVQGTYGLAGGTNGSQTTSEIIGTTAAKSGIYALDDDTLNISMGVVPGFNDQSTQNALIGLAESSQNFVAVVAPPEGLTTVQQAIDWTNGQSDERTAAITSNFAAVYWPWVQTYDTIAAKDRWYDPAIYAVRQMAYTDEVSDPWFAPAGVTRGRLTKPTDVEVSVNQGDRDSMYSGGNIVNPIVNFPQQGLMIFGQRTAQRNPTALDRVNVRRLMIQIRKIILASTRRFVFEPNDSVTWEKVENVVVPLLDDIQRRRGLVDYRVICDETTNTAVRVDRNELWCKILLKPTKAAEVIVFELNLVNQSAQI